MTDDTQTQTPDLLPFSRAIDVALEMIAREEMQRRKPGRVVLPHSPAGTAKALQDMMGANFMTAAILNTPRDSMLFGCPFNPYESPTVDAVMVFSRRERHAQTLDPRSEVALPETGPGDRVTA